MKIKIIKTCEDCEYFEHDGLLQANPHYVCHHPKLYDSTLQNGRKKYNEKDGVKYCWGCPIICSQNNYNVDIPKFCPLEDYNEN